MRLPRELAWKMWSEKEHLERWWGPAGFEMAVSALDFRDGGQFHYCMTAPGSSHQMWGKFIYDEIVPIERIVFRRGFADSTGRFAPNRFFAGWPLEICNELTPTEAQGRTVVTLLGRPHNAAPEQSRLFRQSHAQVTAGFAGTFEQLTSYIEETLSAERAISYHRTFDALLGDRKTLVTMHNSRPEEAFRRADVQEWKHLLEQTIMELK